MSKMKELQEENRRLSKMYPDEKLKTEIVKEALVKKVVWLSCRWEIAKRALETKGTSIELACKAFNNIESCYRY